MSPALPIQPPLYMLILCPREGPITRCAAARSTAFFFHRLALLLDLLVGLALRHDRLLLGAFLRFPLLDHAADRIPAGRCVLGGLEVVLQPALIRGYDAIGLRAFDDAAAPHFIARAKPP